MYLVGFPQMQQSCSLSEIITSAFISILSSLNNSLVSLFRGIDTTKIVQTNITSGTYTATEDCYAVGRIRCKTAQQIAIVYLDGVEVSATASTSSTSVRRT